MGKLIIGIIRITSDQRNEESAFEKIKAVSGRKETECQCEKCKSQCKTPCLGTPDDILKLIKAGYGNKLSITDWGFGMIVGEILYPIRMIQAIKTTKGCIFFKDGLCELHDKGLKPTEGRLSHHEVAEDNINFKKSVTWNVAKEWEDTRNIPKILRIVSLMQDILR